MPDDQPAATAPALTACSLCAGETLEPAVDAPGRQAARLRALAERGSARLSWVECLDACERGDVVVARPAAARRRAGTRPVWFERLAGDGPTQDLERCWSTAVRERLRSPPTWRPGRSTARRPQRPA